MKEAMVQVFKVEELKKKALFRMTAATLGKYDRVVMTFTTQNKDDYPMGAWVTVKFS